jgi:geranylgeranyl transferase type-2 subunit beta
MGKYLEDLTIRLARGAGELDEAVRKRHTGYFLAAQRDDGGFAGREGNSDLYYTAFGMRALSILGELYGERAERSARFIKSKMQGRESIVDFLSLIYGGKLLEISAGIDVFAGATQGWRQAIGDAMEKLRRPDGGYAKGEEGVASSTYHTFLVLLCLELLELPLPKAKSVTDFLLSMRAEEGGFREIRVGKRAGANPTAAAIGSLRILGTLSHEVRDDTIGYLLDMQSDEGGFQANTRIPFADLLSTFTGLLTLMDLGGDDELDIRGVDRFVRSMELETGGFRAAALDPAHDVEYGFYGLGAMCLLAERNANSAV